MRSNAAGGGVAAVDGSHLAIRHSDLSNCHADVYGGAVLAYGGANATVAGSSLHRNTASYGSAIASLGSGTYALIDGCNILGRDTVWSVGAGLSRQCGAAAVAYDAEAAVVDSLIANHTQLHGGAVLEGRRHRFAHGGCGACCILPLLVTPSPLPLFSLPARVASLF